MKKTLVLGLGNTLRGDDGVGVRAVENLTLEADVMSGATAGFSLLESMKNYEKVVVVDAVEMGQAPGTIARFSAEAVLGLPVARNFSLHDFGLLEVLKMGKALNEGFNNVIIIGVQPGNLMAT